MGLFVIIKIKIKIVGLFVWPKLLKNIFLFFKVFGSNITLVMFI